MDFARVCAVSYLYDRRNTGRTLDLQLYVYIRILQDSPLSDVYVCSHVQLFCVEGSALNP